MHLTEPEKMGGGHFSRVKAMVSGLIRVRSLVKGVGQLSVGEVAPGSSDAGCVRKPV